MTFSKTYLLLLTLILGISAYGQMTVATLSPTEDTYVESGSTADNSAGTNLYADITATSIRRSYLKFDIASLNIPTNAVIYSAYLKLPIQSEYSSPVTIAAKRATAAWSASTITYATQPTLETSDGSLISDATGGYRRILVTAMVQKMANMPMLDKGFCVHRYNETGSVRLYQYHSNENAGTKPVLEIKYYIPFYVNNSTAIQPNSALLATDGVISAQISGGPGETPAYQWYDNSGNAIAGATSLTLSGVSYGWYGLRISSSIGDPVYVGFLVGVNCADVNINFNPGPLYIKDAALFERNTGGIDYGISNYGTSERIRTENQFNPDWYNERSLVQFSLWVSPDLNILQSDLHLARQSHYTANRPNTSELLLVTAPWLENTVTHHMIVTTPATTTTNRIEIPTVANAFENGVFDIKNYWNLWKLDNVQNYGFLMQLLVHDNLTYCKRAYFSSDDPTPANWPYIQFKVGSSCPELSYSKLKPELDGGYCMTKEGILKFYFSEDYPVPAGKYLPLSIYDEDHSLIGSVDLDGNITGNPSMPQLGYTFDDNRYTVNFSVFGLVNNKMYLLQVTTISGEKRYLKFLYNN